MKQVYMNKIYYFICYRYLKGKPERKIENLEKILFLMQYQSLISKHKPFLRDKIYIYNGEIRVRYLSDLLRVAPVTDFGGDGMYLRKTMQSYQKKIANFSRLSDDKLNDRVNNLIQEGNLDEQYFVFEKYQDHRMRRIARLRLTEKKYRFTGYIEYGALAGISFRKAVAICLMAPHLIGTILCLPFWISKHSSFHLSAAITFSSIACIFWGIYLIWNYLWMKPTKFEIENGYLEE